MKKYVKWMNKTSKLVKFILVFFAIPAILYRIFASFASKDFLGKLGRIVLAIVGAPVLWVIDIIMVLLENKIVWF